jgi:hypothetical protein
MAAKGDPVKLTPAMAVHQTGAVSSVRWPPATAGSHPVLVVLQGQFPTNNHNKGDRNRTKMPMASTATPQLSSANV